MKKHVQSLFSMLATTAICKMGGSTFVQKATFGSKSYFDQKIICLCTKKLFVLTKKMIRLIQSFCFEKAGFCAMTMSECRYIHMSECRYIEVSACRFIQISECRYIHWPTIGQPFAQCNIHISHHVSICGSTLAQTSVRSSGASQTSAGCHNACWI